jgi:hypothetical protein
MVLQSCVLFFSLLNGIDPEVTKAVIKVESNGNVMAKGRSHGEIGLLQIRPQFVKETTLQLYQPCTNIMVGTRILGQLKKKCNLCIDRTYVNMYNLGQNGARKLKYPQKWKYYRKIAAILQESR